MPNKLLLIYKLLRLNSPTGIFLLFFPCVFGLVLAPREIDYFLMLLFLVGSIVMRSAGCIINDIFDSEFDKEVARTADRPLATGSLEISDAIVILVLLLLIGFIILIQLNFIATITGILSLALVILYPLMKRITYWPQLFLGITFNIGVLIAFANSAETISVSAILLYISAIFWTIGYDSIYGFMDMEDDLRIGIKSSSIYISAHHHKVWLMGFYAIFVVLLLIALILTNLVNEVSLLTILTISLIFAWQIMTLDIKNPMNCMLRFKSNLLVGGLLSTGLIIAKSYPPLLLI